MIRHDVEQGSEAWLQLRLGRPSASELKALVTPTFKVSKAEGVQSYLAQKLAERWLGRPIDQFSGGAMEQGQIVEPEALAAYEARLSVEVERVGFLTTDDGTFGCSPDAIFGASGCEIKSPQPKNHVLWLLADEVPEDHVLQCHGAMFVTGADSWDFFAYRRGFPSLLKRLPRDEKAIDAIREAVALFTERMEKGYARLVEANGGREPRRRTPTPSTEPDLSHPF